MVEEGSIRLSGDKQYLDFSDDSSRLICDGYLDHCPQGFTLSFRIRPDDLSRDQYVISSAPVNVYIQEGGQLVSEFQTPTKAWSVTSYDALERDVWYDVTLTWDEVSGLAMFINSAKVGEATKASSSGQLYNAAQKLYIGRAADKMPREQYAKITMADLQLWRSKRDLLISKQLIAQTNMDPTVQQSDDEIEIGYENIEGESVR